MKTTFAPLSAYPLAMRSARSVMKVAVISFEGVQFHRPQVTDRAV